MLINWVKTLFTNGHSRVKDNEKYIPNETSLSKKCWCAYRHMYTHYVEIYKTIWLFINTDFYNNRTKDLSYTVKDLLLLLMEKKVGAPGIVIITENIFWSTLIQNAAFVGQEGDREGGGAGLAGSRCSIVGGACLAFIVNPPSPTSPLTLEVGQ